MAGYTSWTALKSAMIDEVIAAVSDTTQKSYQLLQSNVNNFYSAPQGIYQRTGQLNASPSNGGVTTLRDGAIGYIYISTGTQYVPAGRDTKTIYQYAENGGLLGNGGFWRNTESRIQEILNAEISKHFG